MNNKFVEASELKMANELIAHGRKSAAIDGAHLIVWGAFSSLALVLQYFAEVRDWAPSSDLWIWQPLFVLGFVITIFLARSGAGKRMGNPVCNAYAAAFTAAGIGFGVFLIASGLDGRPDPIPTITLLSGLLFAAFFVLAIVTQNRWMFIPAAGWLAMLGYYATIDQLVPRDFFVLAFASSAFLALPGLRLKWEQRTWKH